MADFVFFAPLWSHRADPAKGPGDQGPEAEDRRSHGRHAQHLLHGRQQQHDPRGSPLLLQVHGHQFLRPGPQRLRLPAHEEVNTSPPLPPAIFLSLLSLVFGLCRPTNTVCSWEHGVFFTFVLPRRQVRRMLYRVTVLVVVKTKDKKNNF